MLCFHSTQTLQLTLNHNSKFPEQSDRPSLCCMHPLGSAGCREGQRHAAPLAHSPAWELDASTRPSTPHGASHTTFAWETEHRCSYFKWAGTSQLRDVKLLAQCDTGIMLQNVNVNVKSLSRVRLFATPWTVAYQASLSMDFSRQQYWNGLLFPSPRDLPNPRIEPRSPTSQTDALPSEPPGKSHASEPDFKSRWAAPKSALNLYVKSLVHTETSYQRAEDTRLWIGQIPLKKKRI